MIADAVNKMHEDRAQLSDRQSDNIKTKKKEKTSNQNNLVNEFINETKVEI